MGTAEGGPERAFDAFGVGGGFAEELLGAGGLGGVGVLPGNNMEEGEATAAEGEGAEAAGFHFLLPYDSAAYAPPISSSYPPAPPCFAGGGGFENNAGDSNSNHGGLSHKSGVSSTTVSSTNSGGCPSKPKPKMKTEQRKGGPSAAAETVRTAAAAAKKPRKEEPAQGRRRPPPSSSQRRTSNKVRKEKLGERINSLQQLVSPFGKTDTASVLHEALGYIRFLHDQVQVLSSPYLQRPPCPATPSDVAAEPRPDLRSRGLCLVPVATTAQVAATNGADLWSPAPIRSSGDDHRHGRQHAGISDH